MSNKRAENRRKKQSGPPNQQRSWFLPVVVLIVVVGVAGVAAAALSREPSDPSEGGPRVGDHWHIAYGVYDCDTYVAPSSSPDHGLGIHTHGDGLIHAHPARTRASGDRARLAVFTDAIGAELTDQRYVPGPGEPEGRELRPQDGCNGRPAELVLAYWPDATAETAPEIIREDLADFRFAQDGSALAIALVPEGSEDVPRPPFLNQLQNPGDT